MTEAAKMRPPVCPNCGRSRGVRRYCPNCGQRQSGVRLTMRQLVRDFVEDQFSIDAALPRTLRSLFLRPGHLTGEYIAGRRRRYIPPFRLYIVFSLVFFLALALSGGSAFVSLDDRAAAPAPVVDVPGSPIAAPPGPTDPAGESVTSGAAPGHPRDPATEGVGLFMGENESGAWVNVQLGNERMNEAVAARLSEILRENPEDPQRVILEEFLSRAPTAAFFVLPIFALLLKLLYLRSGRYYVEHFVFGLHQHAFAFAVSVFIVTLQPLAPLVLLWLLVYTFLAMRRVYGQGRLVTALKLTMLSLAYVVVIGVWLAFTLAGALLLS